MKVEKVRHPFGAWLRWWREEQHWTQLELAGKLGYSSGYVSRLEQGLAPPAAVIARVSTLSGVPPEAMIAVPARRAPVPIARTSLIARDEPVASITEAVQRRTGLFVLVGPAGVGKTRVAMEIAARAGRLEHGAWWVSLVDVTDGRGMAATLVQELGLSERGRGSAADRLARYFRGQTGLLVLDNFEQLIDVNDGAALDVVQGLLSAAPRLRILVTSREALRIDGEHVHRIEPLEFSTMDVDLSVTRIREWPATALFLERAVDADPPFRLTEGNVRDVAEICALLDGLPLAIELAAANAGGLSAATIASSLRDSIRLLEGAPRRTPSHHQTLTAAIDWSYRRLPGDLAALFLRLAIFPGGATPEAATVVCGAGDDEATVRDGMLALARRSLLVARAEAEGGPRYGMLHAIRVFALALLTAAGGRDDLERRHCRYFAALAADARPGLLGGEQAGWVPIVHDERPNIEAAMRWALTNDPGTASAIAASVWRAFWLRGSWTEGQWWIDQALEATAAWEDEPNRSAALAGRVVLLWSQGRLDDAWVSACSALEAAHALGNRDDVAMAVLLQGIVHQNRRHHEAALERFDLARRLYEELADARGRAMALNCEGMVALERDDNPNLDAAGALFARSLELLPPGDHYSRGLLTGNLGFVAWRKAMFGSAEAWYTESLRHARAIGDQRAVANRESDLSRLAFSRGDVRGAIAQALSAVERFRRMGDRPGAAEVIEGMGVIAAHHADVDVAAVLLATARVLREEIGSPLAPPDQAVHDAAVEAMRRRRPTPFDDLADAAGALSIESAIDKARTEFN